MESEKIHLELNQVINDLHLSETKQVEATNETIQLIKQYVFDLSKELFKTSKLENYYWEFSSFSTYENHYSKRLDDYLKGNENEQFSETNFINNEISLFNSLEEKWYLDLFEKDALNQIQKAFLKKRNFLKEKTLQVKNSNFLQDEFYLDLQDTSAAEKIVYLSQLGILDFLKTKSPFNMSTNKLATVLSAITGEKVTTLQSYLNPIFSSGVDQKKNPLANTKNTLKIKSTLNDVGFEQ